MVKRWLGQEFKLKDGDHVVVQGVRMSPSHRVVLDLEGTLGKFNLTTTELEGNIA